MSQALKEASTKPFWPRRKAPENAVVQGRRSHLPCRLRKLRIELEALCKSSENARDPPENV